MVTTIGQTVVRTLQAWLNNSSMTNIEKKELEINNYLCVSIYVNLKTIVKRRKVKENEKKNWFAFKNDFAMAFKVTWPSGKWAARDGLWVNRILQFLCCGDSWVSCIGAISLWISTSSSRKSSVGDTIIARRLYVLDAGASFELCLSLATSLRDCFMAWPDMSWCIYTEKWHHISHQISKARSQNDQFGLSQ